MKKRVLPFILPAILSVGLSIVAFSCSGNDSDSAAETKPVAAGTDKPADPATGGGCCFTQDSDFDPFFPKGNAMIFAREDHPSTNFFCGASDDPKKSSATMSYQIDTVQFSDKLNYKYISLRIEDHSADPSGIQAKIERKTSSSLESAKKNTNVTVKEVKSDRYTGYSWVDVTKGNNSQNILIEVVVDGRFLVHIQGVDHSRIDLGMELLEMIPVKDLAGKCK
jgi:hypothetical protein